MGIFVHGLARMRDFYVRVLGFVITDEGDLGDRKLTFLSRNPDEHHQIVLCEGRPADIGFNTVNQISFRVAGLAELRALHELVGAEADASELTAISHVIAWSIYFKDPEGNRIEVFADSPWYVAQPIREPIDLSKSDADLFAETEARARADPSFRPVTEWRQALARKIEHGPA